MTLVTNAWIKTLTGYYGKCKVLFDMRTYSVSYFLCLCEMITELMQGDSCTHLWLAACISSLFVWTVTVEVTQQTLEESIMLSPIWSLSCKWDYVMLFKSCRHWSVFGKPEQIFRRDELYFWINFINNFHACLVRFSHVFVLDCDHRSILILSGLLFTISIENCSKFIKQSQLHRHHLEVRVKADARNVP